MPLDLCIVSVSGKCRRRYFILPANMRKRGFCSLAGCYSVENLVVINAEVEPNRATGD